MAESYPYARLLQMVNPLRGSPPVNTENHESPRRRIFAEIESDSQDGGYFSAPHSFCNLLGDRGVLSIGAERKFCGEFGATLSPSARTIKILNRKVGFERLHAWWT